MRTSPPNRASWRSRVPAIGFGWRGRRRDCRSPTWRRGRGSPSATSPRSKSRIFRSFRAAPMSPVSRAPMPAPSICPRPRSAPRHARNSQTMNMARGRLTQPQSPPTHPPRHPAAIEKSDFSELPGRTYVTGFARAYARAVDLPEAEIGAAVRQELEDDEYGSRPLYEAYEPTDPARLPTARLTWTLVIVTLLLASAYGVWRFLSVEPDEALIAAQNRAADESEAPQSDAAAPPATKAGAVAANAPVVLTGLAEVWIGFDDATGKTENWRTLEAGEVYQVQIGRAHV